MRVPETRYAKSSGVHIAYPTFGTGPPDLVVVPGWASHIEYAWEDPVFASFLERLGSFSRVTWFDKRGTGLSDRDVGMPTLEERMDDVRAVMEAAGIQKASIFGISEGGSMSALFAATYPDRVTSLILYGAFAKRLRSSDYPWAPTREEREKWVASLEQGWGGDVEIEAMAPSRAYDPGFRKRFTAYSRMSVSPASAVNLARLNTDIDIRGVLPSIHVPTLVLHRRDDRDSNIKNGEYLAKNIPRARFIELRGEDHMVTAGDTVSVLDPIQEFLTGTHSEASPERVLATIMFTDIVESTKRAVEMGDADWKGLLLKHNDLIRSALNRFRGKEVKTTGDGFVATFDGPGRAIRCALAMCESLDRLGMRIENAKSLPMI